MLLQMSGTAQRLQVVLDGVAVCAGHFDNLDNSNPAALPAQFKNLHGQLGEIFKDKPTLSIVATRRNLVSRSGASHPIAAHAYLNSSISPTSLKISEVIPRVSMFMPSSVYSPSSIQSGYATPTSNYPSNSTCYLSGTDNLFIAKTARSSIPEWSQRFRTYIS